MCYARTAKCRTHLFVIRPSSGPEMAFLCIPQILLHQGAGEMCTFTQTIPPFSSKGRRAARKWSIILVKQILIKRARWRRPGNPDCDIFSMTEDQSGRLQGILGTPFLSAACNKSMLFSLACFCLAPTVFSVFHHSVQLSFLPLPNRPADAEPGSHSKTAGVQVSNLINTQNCFPPPNTFHSLSNIHTEWGGKKSVPHYYFIEDTVAEGDEQQNKDTAKADELWTILPIAELSSLVLGMNKHAEYM